MRLTSRMAVILHSAVSLPPYNGFHPRRINLPMHRRSVSVFALLPLALSTQVYRLEAQNAAVVYQNTMNPTGRGFGFNGAVAVGQSVATNIDVNQLNLAPSSAGAAVVALSFLAYSAN